MTVQILRKKFTVGQYHQMIESGILTERDRVELLQGEIQVQPFCRGQAIAFQTFTDIQFTLDQLLG